MLRPLAQALQHQADELGFALCGFAKAELDPIHGQNLKLYCADNRHASMAWLAARADVRDDPRHLLPTAQTIIMLGLNYGPKHNPLADLAKLSHGVISVYAQGEDYHPLIKKRMQPLVVSLAEQAKGATILSLVDTAAIMEKPLAVAAGLGWQGKHTGLLNRDYGNWLFLSAIVTDWPFEEFVAGEAPSPSANHCGACQACLTICPTKALTAAGQIDARRCLSYLNIEHRGAIPREFRKAMGNRIYGCDDCLAICPWNKFAKPTKEAAFVAADEHHPKALSALLALNEAEFRQQFRLSPLKRIGFLRFLRNIIIAAGNSKDTHLIKRLLELGHIHDDDVILSSLVWSLFQLMPHKAWRTALAQWPAAKLGLPLVAQEIQMLASCVVK